MTSLGYTVSDALAMTRRNLIRYVRIPTLLVFSTVQPIMFVLLFAYVFGGAIRGLPKGEHYIDFLMPGIFVQTVVFGSTQTGVGLAEDLSKGMIERFRSLPMARSAVLAGRTLGDSVRNTCVILLMTLVGLLIGFRLHVGILATLLALVLAVGFGFAFSWISATIGLAVHDVESAQTAGFVWVFPLTFASSVFVPLNTMPGWLQTFAKINPITNTADALRGLTYGGRTAAPVLYSLAWIIGILAVFIPFATRNYRKVV
jgi:ABC transporter DrrB family efflux protein